MSLAIQMPVIDTALEELHDLLYTNHEVAEYLHKNHKTINTYAREKRFPKGCVIEIGSNRIYKLDLIIKAYRSNYDNGVSNETLRLKGYDRALEQIQGKVFTNHDVAYIFRKDVRTIDSWARQKRFPKGSVLEEGCNRLYRLDLILREFEKRYNEKRVL